MKGELKKNICNLSNNTILSKVEDLPAFRAAHIGDALGYACCFWTTHLARITGSNLGVEEVQKEIDGFFTTCFLSWIEVLSLLGKLDIGVYALNDIEQWYLKVSCMWRICSENLSSCSCRQEIPASGPRMASAFSWNILT